MCLLNFLFPSPAGFVVELFLPSPVFHSPSNLHRQPSPSFPLSYRSSARQFSTWKKMVKTRESDSSSPPPVLSVFFFRKHDVLHHFPIDFSPFNAALGTLFLPSALSLSFATAVFHAQTMKILNHTKIFVVSVKNRTSQTTGCHHFLRGGDRIDTFFHVNFSPHTAD